MEKNILVSFNIEMKQKNKVKKCFKKTIKVKKNNLT
jgi:hypothetical protein